MSYSPVISYMMDRLSGFSTSSFRLQCLGSDSATANQIVRFELPTNALVDVRKFSFAVKLAVTGSVKAEKKEVIDGLEKVIFISDKVKINLSNEIRRVQVVSFDKSWKESNPKWLTLNSNLNQ